MALKYLKASLAIATATIVVQLGCGSGAPQTLDAVAADATDVADEAAAEDLGFPDSLVRDEPSDVPTLDSDARVCQPTKAPRCYWNDVPVSCDLAMAYLGGNGREATSPRARCEQACSIPDGLQHLIATSCWSESASCWRFEDFECDACCTLPYTLPSATPDDGDPCTEDSCSGATCNHEPFDWIGSECTSRNDFGACPGSLICQVACAPPAGCFWDVSTCTARSPEPESVNGIDDDCDGLTDEDNSGGVLRFSRDDNAANPSVAVLSDGRFVVAWQSQIYDPNGMGLINRVQLRTGTAADPLGGSTVTIDEGDSGAPCVWGLADGRFALSWAHVDQTDIENPLTVHNVWIMRGVADPPESKWQIDVEASDGVDCYSSVRWSNGTIAIRAVREPPEEFWLQRFDRTGPVGEPFQLPDLINWGLRLMGTDDGGIIAAWQGSAAGLEARATFNARWYDANGNPTTDAFLLTDETYRSHGDASGPVLTGLADGRVVAAWSARPIYDSGRYFRAIPLAAGDLPDTKPMEFAGEPAGRPEVIDLVTQQSAPVLFWKDIANKDNPMGINAVWLDPVSLLPAQHRTIQTPDYGILEKPQLVPLTDSMIAAVWVYRPNLTGTGVTELRLALVAR